MCSTILCEPRTRMPFMSGSGGRTEFESAIMIHRVSASQRLQTRAIQSMNERPVPAMNNLTCNRRTFVTHLECGLNGDRYEADQVHGLSKAGRPLLVRYDLEQLAESVSKQDVSSRPPDMWRYRECLPVRDSANTKRGTGWTPFVTAIPMACT